MAMFRRTEPCPEPPKRVSDGYTHYRPYVRQDFKGHCAYCLLGELFGGGMENFELDHFRPRSRFPGMTGDFYNLYYACHPCNRIKRDQWPSEAQLRRQEFIVDHCTDEPEAHFVCGEDGKLEGLTPAGQYTIDLLILNRPHLIELRQLLSSELNLKFPYRPSN